LGPRVGAGVNATLMSYADSCNIGINIDTGAIDDPELWLTCLSEAFHDVLALGSVSHAPHEAAPVNEPH
jgi:diacylglycerol O-acyltransferase / wax synthase